MVIRLIDLTLTIRLCGMHPHPQRLRGKFAVACGDTRLHNVDIVEGHLNKGGAPQRLISLEGETALWHAVEQFENQRAVNIFPADDTPPIQFTIDRASIEIVGTSNGLSTEQRYRGNAMLRDSPTDVVALNEAGTSGKRRFYLTAPLELLLKVRDQVHRFGGCDLEPIAT
jgi:hypothetical protein